MCQLSSGVPVDTAGGCRQGHVNAEAAGKLSCFVALAGPQCMCMGHGHAWTCALRPAAGRTAGHELEDELPLLVLHPWKCTA